MMFWDHDGFSGMWHGYQVNSTAYLGMMVMILLLIVAVGVGVWLLVRTTRGAASLNGSPVSAESPRAILDRRFASGEIDAEEYANARRVLQSPGSAANH
jgi:putative membrane protein